MSKYSGMPCKTSSLEKNCFKIFVWWNNQYLIPKQKDVYIGCIKHHDPLYTIAATKKKQNAVHDQQSVSRWWRQSVSQCVKIGLQNFWHLLIIKSNEYTRWHNNSYSTYLASSASLRTKAQGKWGAWNKYFVPNFARCSPFKKNSFTSKLGDKFVVVKQHITS